MLSRMREWSARRAESAERRLVGWGFSAPARDLIWHYWQLFKEQLAAVIPISLLQILVLAIFFQQAPLDAGLQVMGLVCAIFGLMAFLEGLRVCIMPFAELLGSELPAKVHVSVVLLVSFFLGVLVTYAEPAISAIRPLASLVDPSEAPYLYYLMNQQQEILVLCIGLGVGVAAVIGTLRFICNWPLKPLIYLTLAPTVGAACYMQWGNSDLAPILGVAWDCGGVTTGPVTVPILLALGIGVMRSQRQKRLATLALEQSVAAGAGQALEGFGIVTLASLFPVLMVELLGIVTSLMHPYEDVRRMAEEDAAKVQSESAIEKSPLKEVIFAIRAILPLIVALCLLIWLLLRRRLPVCSWAVEPRDAGETSSLAPTDDASVRSGTHSVGRPSISQPSMGGASSRHSALSKASMAVAAAVGKGEGMEDDGADLGASAAAAAAAARAGDDDKAHIGGAIGEGHGSPAQGDVENGAAGVCVGGMAEQPPPAGFLAQYGGFLVAVAVCQIGMIAFNIGLSYGFTALGNQTGTTLPASFLEVSYDPRSPYYSYAGGLILTIVVIFFLGILATRAEPALNVLGRTVEKLSGGSFTAAMLIGAVCIGVGIGMVAGSLKILYSVHLIYFLLAKYAVAVALTVFTDDSVTAVAWDSAGVTTGPVTVPFVLSIGIGFSKAVGSAEGFGMLTIMSVAPIISVLAFSHIRKPAQNARRKLSYAARTMSRSMRHVVSGGGGGNSGGGGGGTGAAAGGRRLRVSQSTAQAAFAMDVGGSALTTPDSSFKSGHEMSKTSSGLDASGGQV